MAEAYAGNNRRVAVFLGCCLLILAIFSGPLWELARYSSRADLYSHILLLPLVSAYLVYRRRKRIPWHSTSLSGAGFVILLMAVAAAAIHRFILERGFVMHPNDGLSLMVFACVTALVGCVFLCFGTKVFGFVALPVLLLYFAVPFPERVFSGINCFLQSGSAGTLFWLLKLTGTPVLKEGMVFGLPGLTIEVAPECSGIRSTLVLLITSLIAGDVLLRTGWRKGLVAAATLPIGIVRNATRIATVCLMTIHVDPDILRGPLHRQGGPPFFVLSLVPLFAILLLLRRSERRGRLEETGRGGAQV